MPYDQPITVSTPYQLQQLNTALSQPNTQGYTFLGQLWRNAVTNLTGGLVDVMGISQHNREIKASGGSTGSALLEALGSAVVSGQNQFLGSSGTGGGFIDSLKNGAVVEYVKKYLPWLIIGIAGLTTVLVLIFRRRN